MYKIMFLFNVQNNVSRYLYLVYSVLIKDMIHDFKTYKSRIRK